MTIGAGTGPNQPDYRALFEGSPAGLLVLDPALRIAAATDRYLQATMTSREEVMGRHLFEVFPDNPGDPAADGVANLRSSLDTVMSLRIPHRMAEQKYDIRRPESEGGGFEERWWLPENSPVLDDLGNVVWIIHHVMDITELRRTYRDLATAVEEASKAREAAERANRAKSEFLSRMSHELRTPLNAILGFAQLLDMDELTQDQRENLSQILRGGRHLLSLINEVLDISRIEAGTFGISPEPVDVGSILDEAVGMIRPLAANRSVSISVSGVERGTCVLADRQRLRQVLLNLFSNAVKYNRAGGRVDLTVAQRLDSRVRISIRDTGEGLGPEKLRRLFTPFDRLGAETGPEEGTGLGLSLSKRLVEAMEGELHVESVVGSGTTFHVDLWLAPASWEVDAPAGPGPAECADPGTRGRLLYIEDNLINVRLVEHILRRRPGVEFMTAIQGSMGLALAREHQPDAIFLDLHLPDMEGEAVLQRLLGDPLTASIPVVILSADATPGKVSRLHRAGARDFMTKPLDIARFLATVDALLGADGKRSPHP